MMDGESGASGVRDSSTIAHRRHRVSSASTPLSRKARRARVRACRKLATVRGSRTSRRRSRPIRTASLLFHSFARASTAVDDSARPSERSGYTLGQADDA